MAGLTLNPGEKDLRKVVDVVRQLTEGKNNATGTFTLTPSATTTVVQNPSCSATSFVFLSPLTPDAAAAVPTTSIVAGNAQFVVTHALNTQVDRTFGYAVLG